MSVSNEEFFRRYDEARSRVDPRDMERFEREEVQPGCNGYEIEIGKLLTRAIQDEDWPAVYEALVMVDNEIETNRLILRSILANLDKNEG
jgi:hypothetical protein